MSYFVDRPLFDQAVEIVRPAIEAFFDNPLSGGRKSLYVVVDVPSEGGRERFEVLIGAPEPWEYPFDTIAHGKADLCLRTGRPTSVVVNQMPWLLLKGDKPFAGGVIEDDLVVASSGQEDHFDEMFSWMLFNAIAGLSTDAAKRIRVN